MKSALGFVMVAYLLAPRVNWVPLQHPGYAAYSQPYTQLGYTCRWVPVGGDLTLNLTDLRSWLLNCRSSPAGWLISHRVIKRHQELPPESLGRLGSLL